MTNYIDIQHYISVFARYHNQVYRAFLMILS